MKSLSPYDECLTLYHSLVMNIIIWNCTSALKPSFQKHVRELVSNNDSANLIVMETKIGGDRAGEITKRLPFDGVIHIDTIGYAGGLWMLWNSNKVEISPSPKQNRKFMSPSRYVALTLFGTSLLYMLVLGVPKDTYYGILYPKL